MSTHMYVNHVYMHIMKLRVYAYIASSNFTAAVPAAALLRRCGDPSWG